MLNLRANRRIKDLSFGLQKLKRINLRFTQFSQLDKFNSIENWENVDFSYSLIENVAEISRAKNLKSSQLMAMNYLI